MAALSKYRLCIALCGLMAWSGSLTSNCFSDESYELHERLVGVGS